MSSTSMFYSLPHDGELQASSGESFIQVSSTVRSNPHALRRRLEQLRRILRRIEDISLLATPLGEWVVSADRWVPRPLLELPLRDVISSDLSQLESMPSVGRRKLETLATILNRIVESTSIISLAIAQDDRPSPSIPTSVSRFNASQLTEPEWRQCRELVVAQKLLDEPLGRFVKSLRQLPRSTWWTTLGTYCPLTLVQIRSLPAHGPMRVAAILRVFHDVKEATDVSELRRNRPVASAESWVLEALADNSLIDRDAIEMQILKPFFEQVSNDLGSVGAKVAWAKLRFDTGIATPDHHALLRQYSRGRVYQLARDAGAVGQLRWGNSLDQLARLLDTRRLTSNSIEFKLLVALRGEIARGARPQRRARFPESAAPLRFITDGHP